MIPQKAHINHIYREESITNTSNESFKAKNFKNSKKNKTQVTEDVESLLDIIDNKVGQLLIRSRDIEGKLDNIEKSKESLVFSTPFSVSDDFCSSEENVSFQQNQFKQSFAQNDIDILYKLLNNLYNEVNQMRREQHEMHSQIQVLKTSILNSVNNDESETNE